MRIVVDLPPGSEEQTTLACSHLLEALVCVNLDILRRLRGRVPTLYTSRVRYRKEPPGPEHFDNLLICLKRGWGDCDDLVGWRIAELRFKGEHAIPRIVWPRGRRMYHAQVRRGDQSIEDPSRILRRKYA